ncbi:MAG: GldM family protein [Bacteroidia bacterium]
MINMMYLVLTAMLALNVSAEILQAFESLRASLRDTAGVHGSQNQVLAEDIIKAINDQEKGGTDKYSKYKPVISEINTQTASMISYLDGLNAELEDIGQKDPETGEILKKDETTKNYRYWLGSDDVGNDGHGNGKAVELRSKLDEFVSWANKLYKSQYDPQQAALFTKLALEPAEDPHVTSAESKDKTWEYFTFHEKPVIADLALIEKFKMDIRDIQSTLLHKTKEKITTFSFTVDSLIAFQAPSAEVVAAGMKFQTTLAVGLASKSVKPEFVGSGLSMDPGGSTATMTIPANGSVIPDGQSEGIQHYTATIKVPKADGEIVTIPVKGQFRVRRPEVVVRSRELQILYRDCGNTVNVDVPSLGDNYNPDFSKSEGGQVISSATNKKDITIVPGSGKNFKLSVYSNTNGQKIKIEDLKYNVKKPNSPRIVVQLPNGQELSPMQAVSKRQSVKVKLLPDPEFASTLPRDARYKADKVKVMLQDGIDSPKTIVSVSGADIQNGVSVNLSQGELKSAYQGAKIYFQVEGVKRINFQNKVIDENMPLTITTIPATIKQ